MQAQAATNSTTSKAPATHVRDKPAQQQASAETQLEIFASMPSPTLEKLKQIQLDDCSPREALDQLYALQQAARKE